MQTLIDESSDGGQWTDGGRQSSVSGRQSYVTGARFRTALREGVDRARARGPVAGVRVAENLRAPVKPDALPPAPKKPMSKEELSAWNAKAPKGTPKENLTLDPKHNLPRWMVEKHRPYSYPPVPKYENGGKPVSDKDWFTIHDTLHEKSKEMSEAKRYTYQNIWMAEGGLQKDPRGSALAGIRQGTIDDLKKNKTVAAQLQDIRTPKDLLKKPTRVLDVYDLYLNKNMSSVGGAGAIDKVGNKYAAAALADTVFRQGSAGADKILKEAIKKTDPSLEKELESGDVDILKPKTFAAYSKLAQNPAKLGPLLDNVEGARYSDEKRRAKGRHESNPKKYPSPDPAKGDELRFRFFRFEGDRE